MDLSSSIQHSPPLAQRPVTRSQHGIVKPNKKYHHGLVTQLPKSPLPNNPVAPHKDPDWKLAMDDEYNALIEDRT